MAFPPFPLLTLPRFHQIRFRRGLAAKMASIVLAAGEPGWLTDQKRMVVGDGVTPGGIGVPMVVNGVTGIRNIGQQDGSTFRIRFQDGRPMDMWKTLMPNLGAEMDARIAGKNYQDSELFSAEDPDTGSYTRNTGYWAFDVTNLDALSVWNSYWDAETAFGHNRPRLTLLSPSFCLASACYQMPITDAGGDPVTVRWIKKDNTVVDRNVAAHHYIGGDLVITELTAPVDTIDPVKVLPVDWANILEDGAATLPVIQFAQTNMGSYNEVVTLDGTSRFFNPWAFIRDADNIPSGQRGVMWYPCYGGDQSCPVCLVLEHELVALFAIYWAGYQGTPLAYYHDQVQTLLEAHGESLTDADIRGL